MENHPNCRDTGNGSRASEHCPAVGKLLSLPGSSYELAVVHAAGICPLFRPAQAPILVGAGSSVLHAGSWAGDPLHDPGHLAAHEARPLPGDVHRNVHSDGPYLFGPRPAGLALAGRRTGRQPGSHV